MLFITVMQQALENADSRPARANAADLTRASGQLVACIDTLGTRISRPIETNSMTTAWSNYGTPSAT
jgi:hypothetical protein